MKILGNIVWNVARVVKVVLATLPMSMAPIGGASAATSDFAAWHRAQEQNTVLAYSEFILGHADSEYTDEAFCALFELDSTQAAEVANELRHEYPRSSVNFDTCSTTSSARLFNI